MRLVYRSYTTGVNYHALNPAYFLRRAALIEPNTPAIIHKNSLNAKVVQTYAETDCRVESLAKYFKSKGYNRIAVLAPNTPAHLETMFAANLAGGINIGLNYRLTMQEIKYKLEVSRAQVVIVDAEFKHLLDDTVDVIVDKDDGTDCGYSQAINEGKNLHIDINHEIDDENNVCALYFTSGTTGNPKAVEYTYRGVYLAALANIIETQLNCEDPLGRHKCRYLWTLPLFHGGGWTYPHAVTAVRGTHYCLRKVEPNYIWDLLHTENITHYNAAPTVNIMLLNSPKARPLSNPVTVIVAAAPPSAKLFRQMLEHNLVPVHMYGLTETYGPFARSYFTGEWSGNDEHIAIISRQGHGFITSTAAKVVVPQEVGYRSVNRDANEIGEIIVQGNAVTRGYHANKSETSKAFNGWFFSGDLAVHHPDGAIQVVDRKKDVIISGGENISSVAVENVMVKYRNVLEAVVVGLPDDHYGEIPVGFLTLVDKEEGLDTGEFINWMKTQMGKYQIPKRVEVVEKLPKTSTGKIQKNVLRDRAKVLFKHS